MWDALIQEIVDSDRDTLFKHFVTTELDIIRKKEKPDVAATPKRRGARSGGSHNARNSFYNNNNNRERLDSHVSNDADHQTRPVVPVLQLQNTPIPQESKFTRKARPGSDAYIQLNATLEEVSGKS